ncbi:MAG: iron-containing alcohol dehydrogenase [Planctomycetes bacterium]|nr:iron-containing alcohol dehydrogenase [Planctomycetota bacterium]
MNDPLTPFDIQPRTRIIFGVGGIERLGDLARELNAARVLLVSDPGVAAAGHTRRGEESLQRAGLETARFEEVQENPTTRHVEAGLRFARDRRIDLIVGLGGGSSMDCAKGINFLLTNGGTMSDYRGLGRAGRPLLPFIGVPTTAGTGSEAQSFALIADEATHQKMACGDPQAACCIALLDPALTLTQPERVTAMTGMDAIAHAVEAYVTRKRNPVSELFAREAWRLLEPNLEEVLKRPGDVDARGRMLLGAHWAGCAIENSMLGAAHACANPLTARFGVPHGLAVALMLPHVVRFNVPVAGALYRDLAEMAGLGHSDAGEALARRIESLADSCRLPRSLGDAGVREEVLPELAREAVTQWTGAFNPRSLAEGDFLALYQRAFE